MAENPKDRDRPQGSRPNDQRPRTEPAKGRSNAANIVMVVAGLVVAVLLIFWLVGDGVDGDAEITETAPVIEEETALDTEPTEEMVGTGTEAEIAPETELGAEPAVEGVEETEVIEEPLFDVEPEIETEPETAN